MNVRLSKRFDFLSNAWWTDQLVCNKYSVTVSMVTMTADQDEHNVSVARIERFMKDVIGNSILIRSDDTKQIERLNTAGIKTVELPEEPYDQTVAIMLYCKLNAICAGKMVITGVDLESEAGQDVNYMIDDDDGLGPFADEGWWNDEEPTAKSNKKKGKVVHMDGKLSWDDFGLQWDLEEKTGNVITGEFPKKKK